MQATLEREQHRVAYQENNTGYPSNRTTQVTLATEQHRVPRQENNTGYPSNRTTQVTIACLFPHCEVLQICGLCTRASLHRGYTLTDRNGFFLGMCLTLATLVTEAVVCFPWQICTFLKDGATTAWDAIQMVPYAYDSQLTWVGYDNIKSYQAKVRANITSLFTNFSASSS